MVTLDQWLGELGLARYAQTFADNDIDFDVLRELSEADLEKLGLSLGHRRKLSSALRREPAAAHRAERGDERASNDAERRQVTVLFCDLIGSTALAHKCDPEDMGTFIRRFRETCSTAIRDGGGFVAKFMGDGVLAYFGYPLAHEDAAGQAVVSALALTRGVAMLTCPDGSRAQSRIGIATGVVVIGDVAGEGASQELAIAGDTPNLAARLQSIADPDAILVSPGTAQLLARRFELEDLGERALKGFAAPVRITRVISEAANESRFAATRQSDIDRFVGRDDELRTLLDRWERACGGAGQVVVVSAEAGMGKSRLVEAMTKALGDTRRNRVTLQCSPYHVNSALFPVIRHLERAALFSRDDSDAARIAKLEAMLARSPGTTTSAAAGLVADLLSLPTDRFEATDLPPQQRKSALLAALVDVLKRLSEDAPVLLLVEDAHWIDPTTRDLLTRLIDAISSVAVCVVVTGRPEFRPPWRDRAHFASIELERLTSAQCESLVRDVAAPAMFPPELVADIVAKSDGVPLFVEELSKSVRETMIERPVVPSSLHDSLMARLDRLGRAKEVAQVAAVIGQQFSYVLLAAVADVATDELAHSIDKLVEAGIAVAQGRGMELTYAFKHALLHDVAYENLLRSRRQQLHARIAQTLTREFPAVAAAEPELLARHFSLAGMPDAASTHRERAGDRSVLRSSLVEAVAHYTEALAESAKSAASPERPRRELTLLLKLGTPLANVKGQQSVEVIELYERAQREAQALGDKVDLFKATWGLWFSGLVGRRLDLAHDRAQSLVELARESGNEDLALEAFHCRWSTAMFRGDMAAALSNASEGMRRYDREQHDWMGPEFGGHDPGVCAYCVAAVSLSMLGRRSEARAATEQSFMLAEAIAHPTTRAHALSNALVAAQIQNEYASAQRHAERLAELADKFTLPPMRAHARLIAGWAQSKSTNLEGGLAQMLAEYPRAAAVGPMFRYYAALVGDALLRAGRADEALRLIRESIATITEPGVGFVLPELLRVEGAALLALDAGNAAAADASMRKALAVARIQGTTMLALKAASDLASIPLESSHAFAIGELAKLLATLPAGVEGDELDRARALLAEART